jgi:hypothetical protein
MEALVNSFYESVIGSGFASMNDGVINSGCFSSMVAFVEFLASETVAFLTASLRYSASLKALRSSFCEAVPFLPMKEVIRPEYLDLSEVASS